jgi:hypothetical protein
VRQNASGWSNRAKTPIRSILGHFRLNLLQKHQLQHVDNPKTLSNFRAFSNGTADAMHSAQQHTGGVFKEVPS